MTTYTDLTCMSRSDSFVSTTSKPASHCNTPSLHQAPIVDPLESSLVQNPFTPPSSPHPHITPGHGRQDDSNGESKVGQAEGAVSTIIERARAEHKSQSHTMDTPPTTPEEIMKMSSSVASSMIPIDYTSTGTASSAAPSVTAALELHSALGISTATQKGLATCESTSTLECTRSIFGDRLTESARDVLDVGSLSDNSPPNLGLLPMRPSPRLPAPVLATDGHIRPQITGSEISITLSLSELDTDHSDRTPLVVLAAPQAAFPQPHIETIDQQFESHLVARVLALHDYHRYDWMSIAEPLRCYWGVQVSSARILKILQDWGRVRTTEWWD